MVCRNATATSTCCATRWPSTRSIRVGCTSVPPVGRYTRPPTPGTTGLLSSEIFLPCYPWKFRPCHDPRQTPGASADARAPRRRGAAPHCGPGNATLGPRRTRGPLSGAARDDPRPRHRAPPCVREVLRLRTGSVPRTTGHPAARRGRDRNRAFTDRGGHGRWLVCRDSSSRPWDRGPQQVQDVLADRPEAEPRSNAETADVV